MFVVRDLPLGQQVRSNAEGRSGKALLTGGKQGRKGEEMDEHKAALTESLIIWVSCFFFF